MKRILIPTDGSKNAAHAISYALNLFSGSEVEIVLLRSYDIPAYSSEMPIPLMDLGVDEMRQQLKSDAEQLRKQLGNEGTRFSSVVVLGSLVFNVQEIVSERAIDLVVMGTKGASGLVETIIGSNTADVMQVLTCPMLAVPENAKIKIPKQILFATDHRELESFKILEPMITNAKKWEAHVHLLNVLDEGKLTSVDEAVVGLKLDHQLERVAHTFHFQSGKDKAQVIEDYLHENEIDLLAVVPRKTSFFESIFHKSVSRKLLLHSEVPVLVMPDSEK